MARYPDSRYTADARKRVTWLVNTIAQNEVHVATYYYERGAYVAAINRAQTVVTDFQGVPASEKALYIMVLAYDRSEEHTSELQSLMRISYAVFCLKKKPHTQ